MSRRVGSPKAEVIAVTTEANSVDDRGGADVALPPASEVSIVTSSRVGVARGTPVLYLRG